LLKGELQARMKDRKPKPKMPSSLSEADFLDAVNNLIQSVAKEYASNMHASLVKGFHQDLTYEEIGQKSGYCLESLKQEANKKLFPLISKALTEVMGRQIKVKKINFIQSIENYFRKLNKNGTDVEKIFIKNNIKNDMLTILKINLSQESLRLLPIMRSYLPVNQKLDNASFEVFIEKLSNFEDKDLFIILFRLSRDSRIDQLTCSYVEQTLQELKELLNITDIDYNAWKQEVPESISHPINQTNINDYLIIKIDESKDHVSTTSPKYKFAAWLLPSNSSQNRESDYKPLSIPSSEYGYTLEEIKAILTKIIQDYHREEGQNLNIEFFTNGKLLYTSFESWEYNCLDSPTQLKRMYFVNVRSLTRLEKMYSNMPAYKNWIARWVQLQTTSIDTSIMNNSEQFLAQDTTLLINLCAATQEDLEKLFKKALKYGIPLAIGSRCHGQEAAHRTEINTLLQGSQINQLCTIVNDVRRQSPDSLEDEPEHLGHHLLCFLEDPNRMPPFHYLTSNHLR
jgi:hypothetical protein